MAIKPMLSIYDIFGPGRIFIPRASYYNRKWLPDPVSQHMSTGSVLSTGGELPFLCSRRVVDPACLSLLTEAGIEVAGNRYVYEDEKSYYSLLDRFNRGVDKLVFDYYHLPEEVDEDRYWVRPNLLSYLSNKGNLQELVPAEYLPERTVMSGADLFEQKNLPFSMPFVVKLAGDEPAGGGFDVVICRNADDWLEAVHLFASSSSVVVEEFLPINKNFCIQFTQTYDGKLIYLGSAEQVINEEGKYRGNWIDGDQGPTGGMIEAARKVFQKAVGLGYQGIGGIDTVLTEDGRIRIIDLNFRQNGSTAALLLKDSIVETRSVEVFRYRGFKFQGDVPSFFATVAPFLSSGCLIPLNVYRPVEPTPDEPMRISGLLAGHSREEVTQCEERMLRVGFY